MMPHVRQAMRKIEKTGCLVIALVLSQGTALSQLDDAGISQRGTVTMMPLFQRWSIGDGQQFSELSFGLSVFTPLGRNMGLTLRSAHANALGDITGINDFTDTQLGASYYLEEAHLLLSCGLSFPTGRTELTQGEFATSLLLSNQVFNMQVPNYGQGLSVNPGLSWAARLGEAVAVGLGASYQYKGKYKPLAAAGDYAPGGEILLTSGIDVRISETTSVSADVIFTTYQADRLDGRDVFGAGNRWVGNLQVRNYFGSDELSVSVRYRSRGKNEFAAGGVMVSEQEKAIPDQAELIAGYLARFSNRFAARFLAQGRFFQQTPSKLSGINLFGIGVQPELAISSDVSIPARLMWQTGTEKDGPTVTGIEAGMGLSIAF